MLTATRGLLCLACSRSRRSTVALDGAASAATLAPRLEAPRFRCRRLAAWAAAEGAKFRRPTTRCPDRAPLVAG